MQIIAKRKMTFHRAEITKHPNPKIDELYHKIHESFTAHFLPTEIQVAPDWIREDGLFPLAVADGDLIVMEGNVGMAVAGAAVPFIGGWNAGK